MDNYTEYLAQHLNDIIENTPFPIGVYIGRDMKVILANNALKKTWGKGEAIIGRSYMEVLPELAGLGIYEKLWEVFDTGIPYHAKNSRVDLVIDGTLATHYFNYSFTPLLDKEGKVYGIMNTAADITDINISGQQLKIAENKLKLAMESADLGTYETDLLTDDILTSDRFNAIWNVIPPVSRSMIDAKLLPEDREVRLAAHRRAVETNGRVNYEARIQFDPGKIRWVRIMGNIQYGPDGTPESLLGVTQDITAEKEFTGYLSSLVQEKTAELNRSNQELRHFAHVVSHDLKEPLRKIKLFNGGMMDALAAGDILKAGELGNKVSRAADSMFGLIDGILTYAESDGHESNFESVDLGAILSNALDDLEVLLLEKRAEVFKGYLPVVQGIPVLLKQLFYNLLGNALKFSDTARTPVISVRSSADTLQGRDCVVISVSDNGVGIEEKYIENVFKPFVRLHAKSVYEGNGLGLALCRRIVERHGGTIKAVKRNPGAEFVICLPLEQQAVKPETAHFN